MAITDTYMRLPCGDVIINREARQRKVVSTKDLKESIALYGVLNPIIVDQDYNLVAGERRLTASLELGLPDIPIRFLHSLSPQESQIIELEENLKRNDLHWRDNVKAISDIHGLYLDRDPAWSQQKTADALSMSPQSVANYIKIAKNIDNPKIANAQTMMAALNILQRHQDRAIGDALSDICETTAAVFAPRPKAEPVGGTAVASPKAPPPPLVSNKNPNDIPILCQDFTQWIEGYSGPKFNFLHCDFPYGINLDKGGSQTAKNSSTMYDDSPDVYWDLCGTLCSNLDKIMAVSGHLMFWYSMHFHQETLDFFGKYAPSLVFNPFPLIWLKSDNIGLLPDPKRGPRRIYETCLIASREDRCIIKATSNAYSAPTDRAYHPSTKPEPVLRYFFQMFVDQTTKMFDPTCGSGSSLRAAESMGAEHVLGLERDPEHFESATSAYRKFRILKS